MVNRSSDLGYFFLSLWDSGAGEVVRIVESDLRKMAEEVVDRARRLCISNSVEICCCDNLIPPPSLCAACPGSEYVKYSANILGTTNEIDESRRERK